MRSSKSRSRSKNNRNRSVGNVVNRVFDSSGPEGKVRGTPQQIIDKYNQLTRDAQLSNDRVAAENFQQHAEHYLRMLAEAMREQAERQAQQQQQQQDRQQRNTSQNNHNAPSDNRKPGSDGGNRPSAADPMNSEQPSVRSDKTPDDVMDTDTPQPDSVLVDTPENQAPKPRRTRRKPPVETAPAPETADADPVDTSEQPTPDAAE